MRRFRDRARRPTSRAATERIPPSARRWRLAFPAARTITSSMSPTWKRAEPTMNGELHVALDTTDFLIVFPLKDDRRARLIGTVRAEGEQRHENLSWNDVSTRVIEWMRIDVEQRALVLHLSRAPSGRRSLPRGSCVPAGRRRAHPQSRRRARHEHRHRRRGEPRLEARRRPAPGAPTRRCSTPTSRNESRSPGAWSRRPIGRSQA